MKKFGAHSLVASLALISVGGCALEDLKITPVFRNATAERSANWQTIYDIGKERLSAGYYGLALQKFRIAFAKNPKSIDVMNALAVTYDRLGRAELAQIYYAKALDLQPDSVQTLNNLGYSNLMQERYTDAMAYFDQALARNPSESMHAVVMANRQAARSKMQLAKTASEKIIPAMAFVVEKIQRRRCVKPGSAQIKVTSQRVHTLITSNVTAHTDGQDGAATEARHCGDRLAKREKFLVSETKELPVPQQRKRHINHPAPPKAAPRIAVLREALPTSNPILSFEMKSRSVAVEKQETSNPSKAKKVAELMDGVPQNDRRMERVESIDSTSIATSISEPWEEIVVTKETFLLITGFDQEAPAVSERNEKSENKDGSAQIGQPDELTAAAQQSDRAEMEHLNLVRGQAENSANSPAVRESGAEKLLPENPEKQLAIATPTVNREVEKPDFGDETILNLALPDATTPIVEPTRVVGSDSEPSEYRMAKSSAKTRMATTADRPELRHVLLASLSGGPVLTTSPKPVQPASAGFVPNPPITFNVEISNGAGRRNLAARVSAYLKSQELPVSYLTNADRFDFQKTVIFHKPGMGISAKIFAKKLPVDVEIHETSDQYSDLRILLGGDILKFDRDELYLAGIGAPNA